MAVVRDPEKRVPRKLLMLLSLFLSLVMWLNLSGRSEGSEERVLGRFRASLLHHGLAPNMMLELVDATEDILVSVSGWEQEIKSLTSQDIDVRLDLSQRPPGDYQILLTAENVTLPPGYESLEVEDIIPRVIKLKLEERITRRLPIIMPVKGEPAEGYELLGNEVQLIPPEATVAGPKSQLENLSIIMAQPLDVSGAREDLSGRVLFDFSTNVPKGCLVLNANALRFLARIREREKELAIDNTYEVGTRDAVGFEVILNPSQATLSVKGPISVVDWFDPSWVQPVVELNQPLTEPTTLPLRNEWTLPEEETQNRPDWHVALSQLTLTWDPAEVEVRTP